MSGRMGWRFLGISFFGLAMGLSGSAVAQITTCEVVIAHSAPKEREVKDLAEAAEKGDAKAQYELGCLYRWGMGVGIKRDFTKALEWFMKAADQDNAAARYEIVQMYNRSQGGKGEMLEAAQQLQARAESGEARAQYSLGMLYVNGLGVEKDDAQAVAWYEKSAAQGYVDAKARLAGMYARGQGVKQDYAKALALGSEAAAAGNVMAMLNVGRMYEVGAGTQPDVGKAKMYYGMASEKGNRVATALLRQLEEDAAKKTDVGAEIRQVPAVTVPVDAAKADAGMKQLDVPVETAAPKVIVSSVKSQSAGATVSSPAAE